MMTDRPFLVAGGGVAGLAAALGLSRVEKSVRLFEQAPAFEEVGAGLQMSPNGVRALQWLGAWEAVEPACVIPSEIHVRDGQTGAILQRLRLGKPFEEKYGAPYRVCHRADLLAGLVRSAEANDRITLHTGCRATAMTSIDDGAELTLEGGPVEKGRGVIAADGIRSELRASICGEAAPTHRGHTIFRALTPFSAVPPGIEADCVTLWLYPGGHVVHYPVSNWRNFNIVAAIDADAVEQGWSTLAETRELRLAFAESCESLDELIDAPTQWLKWPGADLGNLPQWAAGNTVLMGDAAHATLPYLAQGAVMALEDACVLADSLRGLDVADAFAAFAGARMARCARIQAQSRQQGEVYHAKGARALARNAAFKLAGNAILSRRTDWIYSWQPE
jgi:salicylate hydroxylase